MYKHTVLVVLVHKLNRWLDDLRSGFFLGNPLFGKFISQLVRAARGAHPDELKRQIVGSGWSATRKLALGRES